MADKLRAEAWWLVPQTVVVVVLAVAGIGLLPILAGYALLNSGGVWLYADRHGARRQGRQRILKALAIVLVPVGVLAAGPGGVSVSDRTGVGSDDPAVRKEASRGYFPGFFNR